MVRAVRLADGLCSVDPATGGVGRRRRLTLSEALGPSLTLRRASGQVVRRVTTSLRAVLAPEHEKTKR
jgi:hypothetical protein